MQKTEAIKLLGETTAAAAEAIGITVQAVGQWPDVLPPRIADRVYAALARKAGALPELALHQQTHTQPAPETVAVHHHKDGGVTFGERATDKAA